MMNPFPTMFLALVAHALLRIIFGTTLLVLGYRHATVHKRDLEQVLTARFGKLGGFFALYLALAEILLGLMFVAGFYTQIAAIGVVLYALKMLFFRRTLTYPLMPSPAFFVLALGVGISLFITGAGIFAFDIPI